jgi:hypothetical protein
MWGNCRSFDSSATNSQEESISSAELLEFDLVLYFAMPEAGCQNLLAIHWQSISNFPPTLDFIGFFAYSHDVIRVMPA